jgi:hypothetical protein
MKKTNQLAVLLIGIAILATFTSCTKDEEYSDFYEPVNTMSIYERDVLMNAKYLKTIYKYNRYGYPVIIERYYEYENNPKELTYTFHLYYDIPFGVINGVKTTTKYSTENVTYNNKYNSKGQLISSQFVNYQYNEQGNLVSKIHGTDTNLYYYNNNQLVQQDFIQFQEMNGQFREFYMYDQNNNYDTIKVEGENIFPYFRVFNYQEAPSTISIQYHFSNIDTLQTDIFKFDELGRLIEYSIWEFEYSGDFELKPLIFPQYYETHLLGFNNFTFFFDNYFSIR